MLKFRVTIEMIMCVDVGLRHRAPQCILDVKAVPPLPPPPPAKKFLLRDSMLDVGVQSGWREGLEEATLLWPLIGHMTH